MFPSDDKQFEEVAIEKVEAEASGGWSLRRADGWSFWCPPDSPVEPKAGMTARFYGRGIGSSVRGLYLDGQRVFYRTEAEEAEHAEIQSYGKDAADWLARWDAGKGVWSIEMGGLGPGYEQAIQITAAEVLRHLLAENYDHSAWVADNDTWLRDREMIEKAGFANPKIEKLGLSGAQWGAAMQLATKLFMDGPRKIMTDPAVKDRHIQVNSHFPIAA